MNSSAETILYIRPAQPEDAGILLNLILQLARYEKLEHTCTVQLEHLREALAGPQPALEGLLLFHKEHAIGFATFFQTFSSFAGRRNLFVEDLFVQPKYRRQGLGLQLLRELTRLALRRECMRLEWLALADNQPALHFYQRQGAVLSREWLVHRLSGQALHHLAE